MRLWNAFKYSVLEASTKTLLLKHYYRRQGNYWTCDTFRRLSCKGRYWQRSLKSVNTISTFRDNFCAGPFWEVLSNTRGNILAWEKGPGQHWGRELAPTKHGKQKQGWVDVIVVSYYGRVVRQHALLRRALRRFWGGFWGRVLRRVLRKGAMGFTLQKGSQEGFLEGCFQKVRWQDALKTVQNRQGLKGKSEAVLGTEALFGRNRA